MAEAAAMGSQATAREACSAMTCASAQRALEKAAGPGASATSSPSVPAQPVVVEVPECKARACLFSCSEKRLGRRNAESVP